MTVTFVSFLTVLSANLLPIMRFFATVSASLIRNPDQRMSSISARNSCP